jgi:hypothetical protein
MSTQLDILALEPFYGGARRHMLETLIRYSRHRWTLLKLPPRRIERRLLAAAHWFSELLSRHWVGRTDILLTSEAMNLADLQRLVPALAHKPTVVYFHSNQLPAPGDASENPWEVVNLTTATAAGEVWFNSTWHLKSFLARATAFVDQHPELAGRDPLPAIVAKSRVVTPPIDLSLIHEGAPAAAPGAAGAPPAASNPAAPAAKAERQRRTIFLETRDADMRVLNAALATLKRRGETFNLITVGPVEELAPDVPRRTVSETDDAAQIQALHEAGIIISTKRNCACDHHVIRALAAGCWPILTNDGVYPELIPENLQEICLHEGSATGIVASVLDFWHMAPPDDFEEQLKATLVPFEAISACRLIDEQLEQMAVAHALAAHEKKTTRPSQPPPRPASPKRHDAPGVPMD